MRQPTIIYSADNPQQAHLLRSLLADEGIKAWIVNDAIQIAGGELPVGWRAAAKVVVADDEAAAARRFAEAFDQKAQRHFFDSRAAGDESGGDDSPATPPAWPACPTCTEPRSARCPVCGESGSDFSAADAPSSGEQESSLFLCPSCDDVISPDWYRLCARCGHDFGQGLEVREPLTTRLELSLRTIVVVTVLTVVAAAIGGYFFWLFAGRQP